MTYTISDARLTRFAKQATSRGRHAVQDINARLMEAFRYLEVGTLLTDLTAIVQALSDGTASLDVKDGVRIATAAALPVYTRVDNVITANANGAIAGHASMDGVTPVVGNRILLKDGAAGKDNGIYTFTAIGAAGSKWKLTRATDADTSDKVTSGMYVTVVEGTTLANSSWLLSTVDPITLNTTALVFTQFSGVINRTDGDVSTQAAGDAKAAGTSNKLAAADHKHAMPAAAVAGGATGFMTGVDKLKLDGLPEALVTLATGDAALTTIKTVAVPAGKTALIEVKVTAIISTLDKGAAYVMRCVWRNNAGTLTQVGADAVDLSVEDAAFNLTDPASSAVGADVLVKVAGLAATNIAWGCVTQVTLL